MEEKTTQVHKKPVSKQETESLFRILQTDIPGEKNLFAGLTKIKGASFSIVTSICKNIGIDKKRKINSLTPAEIDKISKEIKNPNVPSFIKNRRFDFESGESRHLITTELDLTKEFDIKRLKKIKTYKGNRHSRGLPVRGQRTKSHFRKKGKSRVVGVNKKSVGKKG
ncbi:MAG: 30S ribosomal protein S13 [Candidatus Pacearchaeota archaeon]